MKIRKGIRLAPLRRVMSKIRLLSDGTETVPEYTDNITYVGIFITTLMAVLVGGVVLYFFIY